MRFLRWMAAACVLLLVSCGPAETAATPEYSVPPEEKRLCIYTSHKREVWWPIVKEFEDRTGIWAEVTEGGTSELLNRIRAEQDHPKADIMFGGGAESLQLMKQDGIYRTFVGERTEAAGWKVRD